MLFSQKFVYVLSILKSRLSSGRVLPFVTLVIMPTFFILLLSLNVKNSQYFFDVSIIAIIGTSVLFSYIMLIVYAPYRSAFPSEEYFKRRGYENTINEYNYVKKILFIAIPIFIFFTFINFLMSYNFDSIIVKYVMALVGNPAIFVFIYFQLIFIVISGLTKITIQIVKKNFRFYFAKGCFEIASLKDDDVDRMKFFIIGLNSYNLYLRRYLKLEIENLKEIYSRVSTVPETERGKIIDSICAGFKSNKLQPLFNLMTSLDISEPEKFLTKQPLIQKIKDGAAFAAVIIPIIISLITIDIDKVRGLLG